MIRRTRIRFEFLVIMLAAAWVLFGALSEFYQIAWGTGVWLGQFALTWFIAFILFSLFCVMSWLSLAVILWRPQTFEQMLELLKVLRAKMGFLRWLIAALLLLAPVYVLQYMFWGLVLHGPYLRIFLVALLSLVVNWLFTRNDAAFIDWPALLVSLTLVTAVISIFAPLAPVTSYPFSLGWSEGNRLWDYSILFGRDLYIYPANRVIPVYLDIGRQFVGGIPFLISAVSIWQVRLWSALVDIVPYLILGWIAFRLPKQNNLLPWMLAGIWAFIFVRQGPIHPPLLICAIVVAFAWGRPLALALPLIFAAGYFAEVSRFTWLFAPALWAVMLELASARELSRNVWQRTVSVGSAGILGGFIAPFYTPALVSWIKTLGQQGGNGGGGIGDTISPFAIEPGILFGFIAAAVLLGIVFIYFVKFKHWQLNGRQRMSVVLSLLAFLIAGLIVGVKIGGAGNLLSTVDAKLSSQPLLWDRLFPNATYGPGILLGLFIAVAPLILVLIYLVKSKSWQLNVWQKASVILPLLAFLIVGLIASVKIGGGGDLHNLDMFIIGLMFAAAIAWRNGGYDWVQNVHGMPAWMRGVMIALMVFPVLRPLTQMRPLSVHKDIKLVATLADITPMDPLPNPLPDTLPSDEDTEKALKNVQKAVATAASKGEILFMDQRQLLTFGYIKDVPLVAEYDKKVLIDQALSENASYFEGFYRDLAAHRFSLIVTSPLNRQLNTDDDNFGDENNAWVKWVTKPLLCYYEPSDVLKKVDVELLVPRAGALDCKDMMP